MALTNNSHWIKPAGATLLLALLLAACATPETRLRHSLQQSGIDTKVAACMADKMDHDLSLGQKLSLRHIKAPKNAGEPFNLGQILGILSQIKDPEILAIAIASASECTRNY